MYTASAELRRASRDEESLQRAGDMAGVKVSAEGSPTEPVMRKTKWPRCISNLNITKLVYILEIPYKLCFYIQGIDTFLNK